MIDKKTRWTIMALHYDQCESKSAIARLLKIDTRTVSHWIKVFDLTQDVDDLHRSGRPKALNEAQLADLKTMSKKDAFLSSRDLTLDLNQKHNLNVSNRTVRRDLVALCQKARIAKKRPLLSKVNQGKKLQFAKSHRQWTQKWSKVVFSDEKTFYLGRTGRTYVRIPEGKEDDLRYVIPTAKNNIKVNVWGCFSANGVGMLRLFDSNLESNLYVNILEDTLAPSVDLLGLHDEFYFLQDNCRVHTSKLTTGHIEEADISLVRIPPYSPDINAHENLWSILRRRVNKRNPKTRGELIDAIRAEWDAIDPSICRKLVESMPKRMSSIIQVNGLSTNY